MKKLITLTMVLALAAAFTTGCKQETKPAAPKADAAKPVQKPMSAAKKADAKPADAKPADAKPADAKPADAKPADKK